MSRGNETDAATLPPPPWDAAIVLQALRLRYPKDSHALFEEVRNGGGVSYSRSCDAIAMSLWPSKGLLIHGFEVKVSRGDWLRELKQPGKGDEFMAVCDHWWLVIGNRGIATPDELPEGWGLLAPRGGSLAVVKQAPKLTPIPLDRGTLSSILRRAQETTPAAQALRDEYQRGLRDGQQRADWAVKSAERTRDELAQTIRDFEARSGVRLDSWDAGRIGDAVRVLLRHGGHHDAAQSLIEQRKRLDTAAQALDHAIETLQAGAQ